MKANYKRAVSCITLTLDSVGTVQISNLFISLLISRIQAHHKISRCDILDVCYGTTQFRGAFYRSHMPSIS